MTAAAPHMTRIEAADRLARIAWTPESVDDVTALQMAAHLLHRRHFQQCRHHARRKASPQELDALRDAAQGLAPDDATPEAVVAAPPFEEAAR